MSAAAGSRTGAGVQAAAAAGESAWFSRNPDKAWAEKFYLLFVPVFFAYNAVVQGMGWLDVGTFWHAVQNLGMWLPYCVFLPWWLRRRSGIPTPNTSSSRPATTGTPARIARPTGESSSNTLPSSRRSAAATAATRIRSSTSRTTTATPRCVS